jgi:RHS repeat-associated protein
LSSIKTILLSVIVVTILSVHPEPAHSFALRNDANDPVAADVGVYPERSRGNFENRLIQKGNGITMVGVYPERSRRDGDGNRVQKTVAGVTTRFLVDDLNPTGFSQVMVEVSGGLPQRQYVYGLDLISQRRRLPSGLIETRFYGYDGHGSVRFLTDTAANVADTYDYDAFGNLINRTGTTPNNYLYAGEQLDADLNLYFLRARYLDVRAGRFWVADPFQGFVTQPLSLHRYLYAVSDPVNKRDPTGRFATTTAEAVNVAALATTLLQSAAANLFLAQALGVFDTGEGKFIDRQEREREPGKYVYRFGNSRQVNPPRPDRDITPDRDGMVGPEFPPRPRGVSAFSNPETAPVRGWYYRIEKEAVAVSPYPLGIIADGMDVNPLSVLPPGHHTIYPAAKMTFQEYSDAIVYYLPWRRIGKK